MLGESLRSLLSQPLVAVVLGLVVGAGIALLNRIGLRFTASGDAATGFMVIMATLFFGAIIATGLLAGFWWFVGSEVAFVAFSVGLVVALLGVTLWVSIVMFRRFDANE